LTLTGTPSPRDLLSVGYSSSFLRGYQASPYRFARFLGPGAALPLAHEEVHPERRLRHAVTLRHNHRASEVTTLRSHLRLYGDDWGVRSVTAGLEVVLDLGAVELGGHARGYMQTRASFYEDEYAQERSLMTADRELSRFYDVFAGARLGWRREPSGGAVRAVRLDLELTGFAFFFPEFSELPRRLGVVSEIGFGVEL
jgi:hypothetical protein